MLRDGVVIYPVNQYDVQRALGCDSGDWGVLCTHENVNPMAKYKPVRFNQNYSPNDDQRRALRYGFKNITPTFATSSPNNKAVWEYEKPRGVDYNEPYRITDFGKDGATDVGYDGFACAPFAFGVQGAKLDSDTVEGNGGVGFPIFVDSAVNMYYANEGSMMKWREDRSLSLTELLSWYSGDAYLGFAIFDIDDPQYSHVVVVSNKKLREISTSVPTIFLTSIQKTINGINYPAVTLFQDPRRDGHMFRFIAFLYNNFTGGNPLTDAYVILPNNVDVNSIAFVDGIDRHDVVVRLRNTVTGLECALVNPTPQTLTLAYVGSEVINGNTYYHYQCYGTVVGTIKTPSDWANDSVRVKVVIRTDYGYPGSVSSPSNYESEINVSLPMWSTTYTKTLATISQASPFDVYFISQVHVNARSVSVSAVAVGNAATEAERVKFDDAYDVYATQ